MTSSKSAKVPKGWEAFYAGLTGMTDRFCTEHLNDEYADLARSAIAALCRKRPSPLAGGNPQTWACAVLYALGQVNFLSDKSTTPHMAMADLCTHFGTAPSTGGNKAKLVRAALGMRQFDHKWTLPSRLADSSLPWLITVDGLVVDARRLPMAIQRVAVAKGLVRRGSCGFLLIDSATRAGPSPSLVRADQAAAAWDAVCCACIQSAAAWALLAAVKIAEVSLRRTFSHDAI